MSEHHCATCICGRRAPVQGDTTHGPGSIAWSEHVDAWSRYAMIFRTRQTAEQIAERGGFGYAELQKILGHDPVTWCPRTESPPDPRDAEIARLREIVREFADSQPWDGGDLGDNCIHCFVSAPRGPSHEAVRDHAESCPWRRANEEVGR